MSQGQGVGNTDVATVALRMPGSEASCSEGVLLGSRWTLGPLVTLSALAHCPAETASPYGRWLIAPESLPESDLRALPPRPRPSTCSAFALASRSQPYFIESTRGSLIPSRFGGRHHLLCPRNLLEQSQVSSEQLSGRGAGGGFGAISCVGGPPSCSNIS